jgi:hypothetical protein
MVKRFVISDKLIHFTAGGECVEDVFARLRGILRDGRLLASGRFIRGCYRCLCFTEAPLAAFATGFVAQFPFTRYSQFGLMFEKNWIFERGGRPVIYEPDSDFDLLPEDLRWRHVRFEQTGQKVIDWTWEREWRIRCNELPFSPSDVAVVVSNEEWARKLRRIHDAGQDIKLQMYAEAIDEVTVEIWRERFPWRVVPLA